jgi:hypothetical protein
MNDKSYVTIEQHSCPVCLTTHDTGDILMDTRVRRDRYGAVRGMRKTFDRHTVTGYSLCPECQKLDNDGYIALIGVDPEKSTYTDTGTLKNENAYRTGRFAHLKRSVALKLFDMPPETFDNSLAFVDDEVITVLQAASGQHDNEDG